MNKPDQALGLLGGTFDPVHNGHVHIATHACDTLPLSMVKFIPCYRPVHEEAAVANSCDRIAMLKLAIKAHPMLSLELCEITAKKPCYTVDTLRQLSEQQPRQPLCFLLGMDSLLQLPQWHRWQQLTDYAHLVVLARPGYHYRPAELDMSLQQWLAPRLSQSSDAITRTIGDTMPGAVLFHSLPESMLASSSLRKHIQLGENCQKDLPSGVWDYILQHQLYT